jgi:cephalosporin-C deacetylase-like acetyl esterase
VDLLGGLPGGLPGPTNGAPSGERTPLNPRVVGEFARQGYRVRKVIFESLPEYYVTANLYLPTTGAPPYPGVLCPIGHAKNGKAYDVYQHLFIGLVKRGYVVLAYDPMGQGERYQYWDFLSNRRRFDFNEHDMAGIQEYLLGQSLARYRIWDGIRALDYLGSLPEVDASRLGATGSSGGGTLTTFISMLDSRVKAASIVCYITNLPNKIEYRINDSEGDPEQDIQGLLAAGIDHTEMVGMIAPRPVLIGAARHDFFPIEGTRQTFAELEQLYRKLGAPDRLKMVDFDQRHMYSQALREATYAWFDHWLKGAPAQVEVHEPEMVTEQDAALQCTPTGQVITSLGGKTLHDFNRAESERLADALEAQRLTHGFGEAMVGRIRARLALRSEPGTPGSRQVGALNTGNVRIEKLLIETEPGVVVPLRVVTPRNASGRLPVVVYLRDRSGGADDPALFEALASQGRVVAVADVRGFGETMSPRSVSGVDYFDARDGMDADFTCASLFLGRPLLGMRVEDTLRVVAYLQSRPDVDGRRLAIAGRGWAGLVALFAAAVDSEIAATAVEGVPVSYGEIARSEIYEQPVSLMLTGVLQDFDLVDVLASVRPRPLMVLNPRDALARRMTAERARETLAPVSRAYQSVPSPSAFTANVAPLESDVQTELRDWLDRSW